MGNAAATPAARTADGYHAGGTAAEFSPVEPNITAQSAPSARVGRITGCRLAPGGGR